jgi:predicted DNA-binding protein (UPF0251 family)
MDPAGPFRCYFLKCDTAEGKEIVTLLHEEIELLKLVDLNGLGQEKASAVMGVSRRTTWKDLHEARRKVIDALINGKRIEIAGCERCITGRCPEEVENQTGRRRHRKRE